VLVKGSAICLGPDIDTDVIIAGRHLRTKDKRVWAVHAFEDLDPTLAARLEGAIIVAGRNFGCGSSREQAAIALKEAGVRAVIAPKFARIFFRNAINIGLPLIECDCPCQDGTMITADLEHAFIEIGGKKIATGLLSDRMCAILKAGGLVEFLGGSG
jgi:methanogen homoaconitase small subunit